MNEISRFLREELARAREGVVGGVGGREGGALLGSRLAADNHTGEQMKSAVGREARRERSGTSLHRGSERYSFSGVKPRTNGSRRTTDRRRVATICIFA